MAGAEIKKCLICDKEFRVKNSMRHQKYCSTKCQYIAMRGTNFHKLIPKIKRVCKYCSKIFYMIPCRVKNEGRGLYCCKKCYNLNMRGENSKFWKGGKSFELYSSEWTKELREYIRKRENYCCAICGKSQNSEIITFGRKLQVHHIDYNKKNNSKSNLIALCLICHLKTGGHREAWTDFFLHNNTLNVCLS
jgi:hypothetical protein